MSSQNEVESESESSDLDTTATNLDYLDLHWASGTHGVAGDPSCEDRTPKRRLDAERVLTGRRAAQRFSRAVACSSGGPHPRCLRRTRVRKAPTGGVHTGEFIALQIASRRLPRRILHPLKNPPHGFRIPRT
ncbi:hypothetical protein B2J93_7328 [Marssonina coronariae]|uniref:Uncharacterized protein n=1 Tax=Diplocarpon coronariae TaxID=2795749 RepID=A0A218Z6S3_9HELO|nr:hypothetical protein B2J93_7328 [Marssonina coronariae]